jgi:hypothetical protein
LGEKVLLERRWTSAGESQRVVLRSAQLPRLTSGRCPVSRRSFLAHLANCRIGLVNGRQHAQVFACGFRYRVDGRFLTTCFSRSLIRSAKISACRAVLLAPSGSAVASSRSSSISLRRDCERSFFTMAGVYQSAYVESNPEQSRERDQSESPAQSCSYRPLGGHHDQRCVSAKPWLGTAGS